MKFLAAVIATVVLGGGAMMGMGYSQQSAAAASAAGGVSCVLPPGQGLPAVGPWPDTLDPVHVAQVAAAAGFTGPDLTIAVAVASAESSHRPHLTNQNTDKHRSVDYGLWQINGYYHPDQMATGDWGNPWDNARMAHSIWEESQSWGGGWGSWVTWKKGLHTKYMAEATAAVAQLNKLGSDAGTCLPGPAGEGGAAAPGGPTECAAVSGGVPANQTVAVRHRRGTTTVHRCLAANVAALFNAAQGAGLPLGGGGYRDPAGQIRTRRANCGTSNYDIYQKPSTACSPPTARPGTSMHERGLAIDFTCGDGTVRLGDQCSRWLLANSKRFGLTNWPVESWHWSTNGR